MWKLWHKIFGFDYVLLKWGGDYIRRRVSTSPKGIKTVSAYGSILVVGEEPLYRQWKHLT